MSSKGRILIVDDEPNVRLVFRTALTSADYEVEEAEDGASALILLAGASFDLVLLDLQMPVVGGMAVLRQLREAGSEVPAIIITAHGSIPDAVEAMKLGAIDFLAKPLTPEALRRAVGDVLRRHAEPAPDAAPGPSPAAHPAPTAVLVASAVVDLSAAKRALNRRDFDRASTLLEQALGLDPDSAEGHTLLGVLYESRGQDHAAYQAYKAALLADPHHGAALDNMRRYCRRFGLDPENKAINPGAGA